eukprot:CAMPEP_0115748702 /NCGR_PEP_ID=MMETSP0272-20121206/93810_1 /TAXON_ID=71861 /ORGANISM="Scrippsiella trochoidea, Strain CCMP3099" /LENGTH=75 /DNA_ID=CAMNT_0003193725 /DNA_START=330 /DNA_END=557 /DNA_ORIENTATION=-
MREGCARACHNAHTSPAASTSNPRSSAQSFHNVHTTGLFAYRNLETAGKHRNMALMKHADYSEGTIVHFECKNRK